MEPTRYAATRTTARSTELSLAQWKRAQRGMHRALRAQVALEEDHRSQPGGPEVEGGHRRTPDPVAPSSQRQVRTEGTALGLEARGGRGALALRLQLDHGRRQDQTGPDDVGRAVRRKEAGAFDTGLAWGARARRPLHTGRETIEGLRRRGTQEAQGEVDRLRREPAHAGDVTAQAIERLGQPRAHRLVEGEGQEGTDGPLTPRPSPRRGEGSHAADRPSSARRSISRDAWDA